jgi:hypothetical protein
MGMPNGASNTKIDTRRARKWLIPVNLNNRLLLPRPGWLNEITVANMIDKENPAAAK